MDQTIKPLLIPPEFALYAEKHSIFELYQVKNSSLLSTNFENIIKRYLFIAPFVKINHTQTR